MTVPPTESGGARLRRAGCPTARGDTRPTRSTAPRGGARLRRAALLLPSYSYSARRAVLVLEPGTPTGHSPSTRVRVPVRVRRLLAPDVVTRIASLFPLPLRVVLGFTLVFLVQTTRAEESFHLDILPILTKAGCNAGACHGAATGQGGFKLSLLGYAPDLDHSTITRELAGRRTDLDHPDQSLLLRKATRQIDHEGDRRFGPDSDEARTLRDWIGRGAPIGTSTAIVTNLVVQPTLLRPAQDGSAQSIEVTAQLSDGSTRPATSLALYSSNDDSIADVNRQGRIRILAPGTTAIMIRFAGAVAAARIESPFPASNSLSQTAPIPSHPIDRAIAQRLADMHVPASPPASANTFLRRVHLDLTGQLPPVELVREFESEPDSQPRRETLIDRLLASDAFTDLWSMRLADLLLISGKRGSEKATRAYHHWLRSQVAANTGWDRIARDLLTGSGPIDEHGPASFALLANDPRDLAEHAASIFLATRIACARCHAHPADRWTRTDYHQFAAFFARIQRDGGRVSSTDQGEVEDPRSGHPSAPRALGELQLATGNADRRWTLANWTTSTANPRFARAFVNRTWKHLMGRGLVEPVDDLRPTNPPTHPELLDALAAEFASNGFNLRHLVRRIVTSDAYQRSSRTLPGNVRDDRLYSHAPLKALDGRVLLDVIAQATGVPETFDDQPDITHAVQLVGTQSPSSALDVLGRCPREASCEGSSPAGGGLAQALHLLNGSTINRRLKQGHLPRWLASIPSDEELLNQLYRHTLSRSPRPEERAEWLPRFARDPRNQVAEDLFWALLNSREFALNH